jgi:hypothetical protein
MRFQISDFRSEIPSGSPKRLCGIGVRGTPSGNERGDDGGDGDQTNHAAAQCNGDATR